VTYAVVRRSVRVLAVDDRGRLLMLVVDGPDGTYHEAPGGGVEPGESVADAARRELAEETGYRDVEIGDPVAWRWAEYEREAGRIGQEEVFVVARVRDPDIVGRPTEPDPGERGHVWLRRAELRSGVPTEPDAPALLLRVAAGDTTPERLPDVHHGVAPLPPGGERLDGGSVTDVRRDGDEVDRAAGPWSPAVHDLLRHLERVGFADAPRPRGIDRARERTTFLPGAILQRPWPPVMLDEDGPAQLGSWWRRYREAVDGYRPPADAIWRTGRRPLRPGEIVAHGDLGVWNTVWDGDRLTGVIDWEFARPDHPLRDLGELAVFAVPLGARDHTAYGWERPPDLRARLGVVSAAAGVRPDEVLTAALRAMRNEAHLVARLARADVTPWTRFHAGGLAEDFARSSAFVRERWSELV
jgi:8-oxo-dGTP pyrophosphatase MutT (NUDIX family)